jgi:hypothetical protein
MTLSTFALWDHGDGDAVSDRQKRPRAPTAASDASAHRPPKSAQRKDLLRPSQRLFSGIATAALINL